MKISTLLGPIALASTVIGDNPGVFKINFNVLRGNNKRDLSFVDEGPYVTKRDGSSEMEIRNKQTFYMANLKVGSNKDEVGVLVDTGSSDLWMMAHDLTCDESPSSSSNSKRDVIVDDIFPGNKSDRKKNVADSKKQEHIKQISKSSDDVATKSADGNNRFLWGFGDPKTTVTGSPDGIGGGGGGGDGSGNQRTSRSSGGKTTNTCTSYGSFKTSGSDSFHRNDSVCSFGIHYADGTTAFGIWGTDDVNIGDVTVKGLSFAIANETTSNVGVLGIGLPGLETTYSSPVDGCTDRYQYENLPLRLKSQGIIEKAAYSVYLGEKDAKSGSILFGAVDSAKYSGDLQTVQIVNSMKNQGYPEAVKLEVIVSGITFNNSGSEIDLTSNGYTAILDTGSTYSYFPTSLLRNVGEALNGQYSSLLHAYIVECVDSDAYSFNIDFSGVKINVPLSDMVARFDTNRCFLSILPQPNSDYILFGDNMLRNAYLVYDLDDFEISLAQAKYTSKEDISIISSSVPNAKKASGYSSTNIPSSATESRPSSTADLGGNSNSGGKSSIASANQLSQTKIYTLVVVLCLLVSLTI